MNALDFLESKNTEQQSAKDFLAKGKSAQEFLGAKEPDGGPYGLRIDGTKKGEGYFGELKRPDGGISTELSIGVQFDGKETEIPSIVPSLTDQELNVLLSLKQGDKMPDSIVQKAVDHAKMRLAEGKSPFADEWDTKKYKATKTAKDAGTHLLKSTGHVALAPGRVATDISKLIPLAGIGIGKATGWEGLTKASQNSLEQLDTLKKDMTLVDEGMTDTALSFLMGGGAGAYVRHKMIQSAPMAQLAMKAGITEDLMTTGIKSGLVAAAGDKLIIDPALYVIDKKVDGSDLSPAMKQTVKMGVPLVLGLISGATIEAKMDRLLKNPLAMGMLDGLVKQKATPEQIAQKFKAATEDESWIGENLHTLSDEITNRSGGQVVENIPAKIPQKPKENIDLQPKPQNAPESTISEEGILKAGEKAQVVEEKPTGKSWNDLFAEKQLKSKRTKAKYASNFRTWVKIMGGLDPNDAGWHGEIKGLTEGKKRFGIPVGMVSDQGWKLDELTEEAISQGWLPPGSDPRDFFRYLETNPRSPEDMMDEKALIKSFEGEENAYLESKGYKVQLHPSTITGPAGGIASGVDWEEYEKTGTIKIDPKKMFIGAVIGAGAPSGIKRSRQLVHAITTKWDEKAAEPFVNYLRQKANGLIVNENLRQGLGLNRSEKFKDILRKHNRDVERSWNKALELGEELQKIAPTRLEQKRLMQIVRGGITASGPLKAKAEKVNKIFAALRKNLEEYQLLEYSRFDNLTKKKRAEYRNIINHPEKYKATEKDIEWARSRLHDHYHFGSAQEYAPLYYKQHEGLSPHEKNVIEDEIKRLKVKSRRGNPEGKQELEEMIAKLENMVRGGRKGRKELKISRHQLVKNYSHRREEISPELQKMLGVIEEAAFPVAKMTGVQSSDVLKGKLFKEISQNFEWARPGTIKRADGSIHHIKDVPANYTQVADDEFGALDGMYVRNDIWDDLREINEWRNAFIRIYDKTMGAWKYGKVVLNPATHARNTMSNVILAYMGDVSPTDVKTYAKAARAVRKGEADEYFKEAADWGLFNDTFVSSEIGKLRDDIDNLRDGQSVRNWVRKAASLPAEVYQGNEKLFKMAVFIKAREGGVGVDAAARKAEKFLFNYGDIPPWVKHMKRWVSPFFTFTYKAVPLFAEMSIRKPHKVAAIMAAIYGVEEYSRGALGMSDAEAEKQRAILPEWQRKTIAGVPMHVLMPFRDKWGNELRLDLSYILPYGNVAEKWGQSALPLSDILPSSPLFQGLATVVANRDPFTGRDIYNEYIDGAGAITQKYLEYAWREAMPSMAPGGYGWNKLKTGIENTFMGKNATDWADRPIEFQTAIMSSLLGIKLSPANEKKLKQFEQGIRSRITRSIGSEKNKLKREFQHNRITKKELQDEMKKLVELEKSLIEGRPKLK